MRHVRADYRTCAYFVRSVRTDLFVPTIALPSPQLCVADHCPDLRLWVRVDVRCAPLLRYAVRADYYTCTYFNTIVFTAHIVRRVAPANVKPVPLKQSHTPRCGSDKRTYLTYGSEKEQLRC